MAMAVSLMVGFVAGAMLAPAIGGSSDSENSGNTTIRENTQIKKVAEIPYGERGVWKIQVDNGTCYYAQTYSGSGYAVSLDCIRGESG